MLSLDEQLDKKVLEIFDALEELYTVQENLEQVMRDGFFNMSRARYTMGVKRVSADQILEAEMKASKTVLVSEPGEIQKTSSDGSNPSTVVDNFSSSFVFTLHKSSDSTEKSSEEKIPHKKHDGDSESGLRKRNLKDFDKLTLNDKYSDEKRTIDRENMIESKGERTELKQLEKPKKAFNPLNLFGVLLPRELRVSQNRFEEAVCLAVQVSNLKQRLESLRVQYKKLKRMKA